MSMLGWLVGAPIVLRLAIDLAPEEVALWDSAPAVILILGCVALLAPLLALCAVARHRCRWRRVNAAAAGFALAAGYIALDGALRVAVPSDATALLTGAPPWTIALRALAGALYIGIGTWAGPWLAGVERAPIREMLGLDGRRAVGVPVAVAAAGIVTLPWPITGSLGDCLTALSIVVESAVTTLSEIMLVYGIVVFLTRAASNRAAPAGRLAVVTYAALGLGAVLAPGGLVELTRLAIRLPLALLLWQLRVLERGVVGALAAAYLAGTVPRLFVDARDAVAGGIPELQHILARAAGLLLMLILALGARVRVGALVVQGQATTGFARTLRAAAAAAVWVAWVAAYLLLGVPGFHNHGFLILMAEQAEVSSPELPESREERLTIVYRSLVETAEVSQEPLRAELDRMGIGYRPYYLTNVIRVDGRRWLMQRFEHWPGVAGVLLNPNVRVYPRRLELPYGPDAQEPDDPQANLAAIRAEASWAKGVFGQGIVVGGQDTGYDWDHPALTSQYRGWNGGAVVHDHNWHDAWDDRAEPFDDGTHGTHTMGTVLGDDAAGNRTGVAPEAEWIGCRNMRRGIGNPGSYLECMEFFLAPYPHGGDPFHDGDTSMSPHVVNNSWGCPDLEGCLPNTLQRAVQVLRLAGIMMVASAGNEGPYCGSVSTPPATYDAVFSVGATDAGRMVSGFSSRGPTDGLIKPDVSAPGDYVRSSVAGGGYGYAGGTSMAGPHVAGLVALVWSADPSLIGDIDQTEALICRTAVPIAVVEPCPVASQRLPRFLATLSDQAPCACGDVVGVPNNVYGCGFVDAGEAVRVALAE